MKFVYFSNGYRALVDDDDYEKVIAYHWHLWNRKNLCYVRSKTPSGTVAMHRIIMNALPGQVVDHIDSNGLNNQKKNLRLTTQRFNTKNRRKLSLSSSQFKGVAAYRGKWMARIRSDKIDFFLGLFNSQIEAAKAYDSAADKLHGEFANKNFRVVII